MAAGLQRATHGFAAVAVAATLVTMAGVYQARQPPGAQESAVGESQALPRPFATPPVTAQSSGPMSASGAPRTTLPTGDSLPSMVYAAYVNAQAHLARLRPGCRLRWEVLAGIGQVESGHARDGALAADGTTLNPILGPPLNGDGFESVHDTDGGRLDRDTRWDRAVGPMQFIPASWATWASDGNHDGRTDPHNVHDATLAAGRYLCAGSSDLSDARQLRAAILTYNRSEAYADTVLSWITRYSDPVAAAPPSSAPPVSPSRTPTSPSPSPPSPASPDSPYSSPTPPPEPDASFAKEPAADVSPSPPDLPSP
ncbi:lytic transglycosylase domain-containing protein [Streptomyces wuyuanensis]|uniref:lytic transglycosylase domain-containing protein n=1 Tax=Streptomyces wuyuanensis TaxID=1196353 RepID=UPI003425EADF